MPELSLLRRLLRCQPQLSTSTHHFTLSMYTTQAQYPSQHQTHKKNAENKPKFLTLPPYNSTISGSNLGKALSFSKANTLLSTETTAFKWVLKCCPDLPRNLVQKLFRLRQVKKEVLGDGIEHKVKRVGAKDLMNVGDRIFLPASVKALPSEKPKCQYSEKEIDFLRGLELYKDDAIIVVNKPPGMPVQGGIGIKRSLDELAASCLRYDYTEPPRLVHRLDRDSSGILVMGRTQTSTTVLHAVFREKTFAASNNDIQDRGRILQRKYWALVVGSPRRHSGFISAPLGKVVVDDGKSDRITVVNNPRNSSSQHAVTQYRVMGSSHGYTWLELSPITGRKHQLRVHCAHVLGTPIVGDHKYGWHVHKNWKPLILPDQEKNLNDQESGKAMPPFGIALETGSICEEKPHLHLHCKQMILPDVSKVLQDIQTSPDYDFSKLKSIKLDAPLPSYMQRSWDILNNSVCN